MDIIGWVVLAGLAYGCVAAYTQGKRTGSRKGYGAGRRKAYAADHRYGKRRSPSSYRKGHRHV